MTKTGKFDEIRRSPPEKVAEHQRWAPYAVKGATLADLRQLCGKTQEEVGRAMGISGVEAGRMEKREDVQVSTLVRFLSALGGELEVYARFGEKLIPLRTGEFSHRDFSRLVAERMADGTWTKETKLDEVLEAYALAHPLQPTPDREQVQVGLVGAKQVLLERKNPRAAATIEYLKAQAHR